MKFRADCRRRGRDGEKEREKEGERERVKVPERETERGSGGSEKARKSEKRGERCTSLGGSAIARAGGLPAELVCSVCGLCGRRP